MDESSSLTGLSEGAAREFHSLYVKSFLGFTAIAVGAHLLVWAWKPWF